MSVYLGKLDKEHGFVPKGEKPKADMTLLPRSVTDYGNSMVLHNTLPLHKHLIISSFFSYMVTDDVGN